MCLDVKGDFGTLLYQSHADYVAFSKSRAIDDDLVLIFFQYSLLVELCGLFDESDEHDEGNESENSLTSSNLKS